MDSNNKLRGGGRRGLTRWSFIAITIICLASGAGGLIAAVRFSSFGHLIFAGAAFMTARLFYIESKEACEEADGDGF
jgi:hypothetical protein